MDEKYFRLGIINKKNRRKRINNKIKVIYD